jgi:hypothetical protein
VGVVLSSLSRPTVCDAEGANLNAKLCWACLPRLAKQNCSRWAHYPIGAGVSVGELVNEVRARLGDDVRLVLHIHDVVLETLGTGWRAALGERFDRQVAESSVSFYDPEAIPRVDERLAPGVSDVHFQVDLTGVPTADLARYRGGGGLLRSVVQR